MKDKQLYEISLEDYSFPRHMSAIKAYYGTLDEINNLIRLLDSDDDMRVRFHETTNAVKNYDSANVPVHNVAGKVVPILTPVQEISRFETQLTNQRWNYQAYGDELYPCHADTVDVCQVLIRTESDYVRCQRVQVSNLSVCYHGIGWVCPTHFIKGFPGIITWDNNQHSMNLFAPLQHYTHGRLAQATADMADISKINLSVFSEDLLGVG